MADRKDRQKGFMMKKMRFLLTALLTCLLLLTSCQTPVYPTAAPTEEETRPEGYVASELDVELEKVGIMGYDPIKLTKIDLYYHLYYIDSTLPSRQELGRGIRDFMNEYFADVDESDTEAMTTAVILSYQQAAGDRYATYFDEDAYREQKTEQNAEFVGIGVYVSYSAHENTVQVLSVYEGTPAAEAGILPGDYIISVDGVDLGEISYYELVNRIRGEVDTDVTVGIKRDGKMKTLTMTRKKVESVSVTYRLLEDPTIGYVKIEQFNGKTAEQFKKAIDALLEEGVEGLVFDLRGNPGGEVNAIITVLDYLLPDGKTVARFRFDEDVASTPEIVYVAKDGYELTLPMTVLCDQYTASAGELFTAALRDHEMATVIGVTTYGKGTAQTLMDLRDGTAFTISTARYDPPIGDNYEGLGIEPHITVALNEEAASVNAFLRDDAIDNQLQTAIEEINRLRAEALQ